MNLLMKYAKILKKTNKEGIKVLYDQAIKAISIVETKEDAKAAVTLVSPFFLSTVFEKLGKKEQEELKNALDCLESKYGSLEEVLEDDLTE